MSKVLSERENGGTVYRLPHGLIWRVEDAADSQTSTASGIELPEELAQTCPACRQLWFCEEPEVCRAREDGDAREARVRCNSFLDGMISTLLVLQAGGLIRIEDVGDAVEHVLDHWSNHYGD